MSKTDITGKNFGRLTILSNAPDKVYKSGCREKMVKVQCSCGSEPYVTFKRPILKGEAKSCGCLQKEITSKRATTHGKSSNSGAYNSYHHMKTRCYNPKSDYYHLYGGRGITVCDPWLNSFENFFKDMGERPKGCTIDRINPNGNYEPSNCRWATNKEQGRNKRTTVIDEDVASYIKGYLVKELHESWISIPKLAKRLGISKSIIYSIKSGRSWSDVKANKYS